MSSCASLAEASGFGIVAAWRCFPRFLPILFMNELMFVCGFLGEGLGFFVVDALASEGFCGFCQSCEVYGV